ncbi:MAG: D-aminoacyl-tRNA deacylase [Propioniciclava sp.]
MRVLIQRVSEASVTVGQVTIGQIERPGLLALVGITHSDTPAIVDRLADKTLGLRILDQERSARDLDAPILVVSQFTLYADVRKGRRPSWQAAAPRELSEPLIEHFVTALRTAGATVSTGQFGAMMQVSLVNDGPVTVMLDSDTWFRE